MDHIPDSLFRLLLGIFLLGSTPVSAVAAEDHPDSAWQEELLPIGAPALSDLRLAEMQGGFYLDNGLLIKFSIQDLVKINGELQAQTVLEIPRMDLLKLQPGEKVAASLPETTRLIQIGTGNSAPEILGANQGSLTIIQNSLNDTIVQCEKILNIEVSRFNFKGNTWTGTRINDRLVEALF